MSDARPEVFRNLESLRGVCAVGVALFHVTWATSITFIPALANAWMFVDFFFVLSGFIIAYTYAGRPEGAFQPMAFLVLRFFRLYPLHIATTLAFAALVLAKPLALAAIGAGDGRINLQEGFGYNLALNLGLLHAMGLSDIAILNAPSWSISAEFSTYGVFALVCALARSVPLRAAAMMAMSLLGLSVLWFLNEGSLFSTVEFGVFRCLFGFGLGGCVWQLWRARRVRLPSWIVAAALISFLGGLGWFMSSVARPQPATLLAPLFFAAIVYLCAIDRGSIVRRLLEAPFLVALGRWSYSIYMVHMMIAVMFQTVVDLVWPARINAGVWGEIAAPPIVIANLLVLAYVAAVIAVSSLTYRWIEAPARAFGRGLAGRRDQGRPDAVTAPQTPQS